MIVSAVAVVVVAVFATGVVVAVRGVADAASTGKAEASAGIRSLESQDATGASAHFAKAHAAFDSAGRSLGPGWVAPAVEALPWIGRQYGVARTLVGIGSDGAVAGSVLARVLEQASINGAISAGSAGSSGSSAATSSALSATLTPGPAARLAALLAGQSAAIEHALTALSGAADRAAGLSTDGLVAPLARAVVSAKAELSKAAPLLHRARSLLPLVSYLFSGDHRILVVSQNGAELRPTGGFAGSFGIVEIGSTGVRLDEYKDVYTLPIPPRHVSSPLGLITRNFYFRDANWWPDFPTSARTMLGFWRDYGQVPVEGLIAIDTVAMKELLAATGPVTVPAFRQTFTAENLLDRLLYLIEVKKGGQSDRKTVLVLLAGELEKRVLDSSPDVLVKSARSLGASADEKHLQMYFTDPGAQAAADALGWSGRVAAPPGTTDLLAICNAMNRPGKVNIAMRKTIAYSVLLKGDRSADTTLVLSYANTGPYPATLPSRFRDWLRVYRAPGVVFPAVLPGGGAPLTITESGLPAEARQFELLRGQSRVETLTAHVPGAMAGEGSSLAQGGTARYRLRVVRQPDLEDIPTAFVLTAPSGWRVIGANARFTASGTYVPVATGSNTARFSVALRGDLQIDVVLGTS
jgi:hypothetical protein